MNTQNNNGTTEWLRRYDKYELSKVLDLDLNLNTAGELELHQSINSLSC